MERKDHGEEGSKEVKMEIAHGTDGEVQGLKSPMGFGLFGGGTLHKVGG